jgi:hypothetical protein
MPGSLAKRTVIAALHQSDPAGRVVADRGDLLLSPGGGRNPRSHGIMIALSARECHGVSISADVDTPPP